MEERRKSTRFVFKEIGDPRTADHSEIPEVRVINISRGGALLQTREHMTAGMTAYVKLVAADAVFLLQGRILRSRQISLPGGSLQYESAVSFEGNAPAPAVVNEEPAASDLPGKQIAYRITVAIPRSGPDLRQIFGLNTW